MAQKSRHSAFPGPGNTLIPPNPKNPAMPAENNLLTPREFAEHLGFRPHYGHQLVRDGRVVMAPDGRHVLVAESIARMESTKTPGLEATVARHAAARGSAGAQREQGAPSAQSSAPGDPYAAGNPAETSAQPSGGGHAAQRPAGAQSHTSAALPAGASAGDSYQVARAVKERFLALEAKRAYEVAIGQLRDAREVEAIAATAMTELRLRLEGLASTLAPTIVAQQDEGRVRSMLQDEFARALESAASHFARLAASAGGAP